MVEDEMCLALSLEDLLTDAGYRVLSAAHLDDAMDIASNEKIDGAILDVNLHGQVVYPLAERLQEQGVPFLFASANSEGSIPAEFREHRVVKKPYSIEQLMGAVATMLRQS